MARKKFVAGNWKMNTTIDEAKALAKGVVETVGNVTDVDIAVCPPFTNLLAVAEILKGSSVKLGAQDVHWEAKEPIQVKSVVLCSRVWVLPM